jgi:hypothetical protein
LLGAVIFHINIMKGGQPMKEWKEPRLYTLGIEHTSANDFSNTPGKKLGAGNDKYIPDGNQPGEENWYETEFPETATTTS